MYGMNCLISNHTHDTTILSRKTTLHVLFRIHTYSYSICVRTLMHVCSLECAAITDRSIDRSIAKTARETQRKFRFSPASFPLIHPETSLVPHPTELLLETPPNQCTTPPRDVGYEETNMSRSAIAP